ncbi:MAG: hypothetical protein ACRDPH_05470 [Marmoricola sp.]
MTPEQPVAREQEGLTHARAVADAVMYEGYLLYPYRASSSKNRTRWQFGVLGPRGAADAGVGEQPDMSIQCLMRPQPGCSVSVLLRFLQLQRRSVERADLDGYTPVDELEVDGQRWLSWDEAVEQELAFGPLSMGGEPTARSFEVDVPGGSEAEPVPGGRLVRRRWPVRASLRCEVEPRGELARLRVAVENLADGVGLDRDDAERRSLLGTHLLLVAYDGDFVSLLDPPAYAEQAAADCEQHRCWPVLAGPPGDTGVVLGSPIIVYDHPEIAEQSQGALYDSTEIDELLSLRVMTLTEAEKAEARATDPRAAAIIDRCDGFSPDQMQQMHGVLRDPGATDPFRSDVPWWDPEADASVQPESDQVLVDGVAVGKGSRVRIHPGRRADAQDLFFADRAARVTAVHTDVDGNCHVAVLLDDDPAAELHDWFGRYLYFAPDELEPLAGAPTSSPEGSER